MSVRTSAITPRQRRWHALPALLLAAFAVACGGGYGGSGGSHTPTTGTGTPASVSVGAITGFGSVHLNGKKFDSTHASITVEGQAATQADLKVGEVVEIRGHHDSSSGGDVADEIEMHSLVQGPVSSVDVTGLTLVVLGQKVLVSAGTSFDDGITPASLAGIAVGDVLEVSGMSAANGDIQATRIERKAATAPFHVFGTAAATDATAKTLAINALTVDFSAATLVDFPTTGPKDGDLLEATGTALDATGALTATRLELRTGKGLKADADGEGELDGLVTRFASGTDFDVAGRPVTTTASTTFEGGSAADLALNVHVEVEGTVDASGLLTATKVRIERVADTRIFAQADTVDATAGTVTLLGITVSVTAMTRFEDHGSGHMSTFGIADVHTGDWLEVRGSESPAGSNQVVAARLDRRDAAAAVRLTGLVKTAAAPALAILSVPVTTTATTSFTDASGASVAASVFFTGLAGHPTAAQGSWDGTTLTAVQASLRVDDDGGGED